MLIGVERILININLEYLCFMKVDLKMAYLSLCGQILKLGVTVSQRVIFVFHRVILYLAGKFK